VVVVIYIKRKEEKEKKARIAALGGVKRLNRA
jgi:hypothetical protein